MKKNGLKQRLFSIILAASMAVSSIYVAPTVEVQAEKGEGKVYSHRSYDSSYDAQYAYSGDDLGCTYTKEKTTFKVWSPEASKVVLCRYENGNGGSAISEIEMTKGDKGVWTAVVTGDIVNTYYTYKVTVNGTTKEAVDIYAKAAGVNGDRAMVVDLDSTDPENWDTNYQREKTLLSDIIVWEVHVRDFSIDASSGVSQENRGKYKAFTESTTVNGAGKTASCVDYLKELGVTHVQILPMYDYASVDETKVTTSLGSNYNWGYDPENYNVPEGSYSSNPYDGNVRITEMKEMIQALHDAGIKVVMDVVYNHTYDSADSNLNKIMPGYYYKLNDDLSFNNQSGCGNATRSESAMYRKYMIDSILYWAEEYNLDGFRFDLMGIHDYETMNQIRSALDNKFGEDTIVMYGEGWTGDGKYDDISAHKANEANLDSGIGYFNDQIRDALKGEHKFDGTIGLVQYNYTDGDVLERGEKWPNNIYGGIMGSVGKTGGEWGMWRPFWSKSSNCSLSYVSAHDNLTLWDKLTEKFGKNYSSQDEKLLNMNKMAGSVVLTSKGGVFMQAGEEFARTKNGDDNSYASSDNVNKIDWNRVDTYSGIQEYYEGMIKIRKAFSGFRSITTRSGDNWSPNNNNLTWITDVKGKEPTGLFGFYEKNSVAGEWSKIAVLINNAITDQSITLDENAWVIIADGKKAGLEKIKETGSSVTVPAKSVVVAVPKATFEACNISDNKAPVIKGNDTYETVAGTALDFQLTISDADGDAVTVKAEGVPSGASFDTATGKFTWSNPVAGTYTMTVTATDGKATATKTITITVTEKTEALKTLVATIEAEGFVEANYTENVWKPFATALETAKTVIANGETDDNKIATALADLKQSYEAVSKEKAAREEVEQKISEAEEKVKEAKADSASYDAEAISDLETVIAEAKAALAGKISVEDTESLVEDLQMSIDAVVSLKANPVIRVKSNWSDPYVYVWSGTSTQHAGAYPGTKLTTKDEDGWYIFNLPQDLTGYSLIVSDGSANNKTKDITGVKESIDVIVNGTSGITTDFTTEAQPLKTGTPTLNKEQLYNVIAKAEAVDKSIYTAESVAVFEESLSTAQAVKADDDIAQVKVNQAVRNLKKAIKALTIKGNVVITVTPIPVEPTPVPTDGPVEPTEAPVTPVPTDVPTVAPTKTPSEHEVMSFSVDGNEIKVEMEDNAAANSFLDSMPIELYFEDYSDTEKGAYLDIELDTSDAPESYAPKAGDLVYYIPWGTISFYLEDASAQEEMIPLGKVISGMEYVENIAYADVVIANTTGETVTPIPTIEPTAEPTKPGDVTPTAEPTKTPTDVPTVAPTKEPTKAPTATPTKAPIKAPTKAPTATPTKAPTSSPVKTEKFTLEVSANGTTAVDLEWDMLSTADVYQVYRATSVNGNYKLVTTINDGTVTSYTNKKLQSGNTYYYYIKAYESQSGKLVCINTTAKQKVKLALAKVTLRSAKATGKKAKITWKKQSGVSGYEVYQSTKKSSGYKKVATVKGASKVSYTTKKKLTSGKKYYYKVRAYKTVSGKKVYGAYSSVKSVTIKK